MATGRGKLDNVTKKVRIRKGHDQLDGEDAISSMSKERRKAKGSDDTQRHEQLPKRTTMRGTTALSMSIEDAVSGLKRNMSLTVWSIVTITMSLFLIGAFIIADLVVNDALNSVEDQVTISAFVDDNASQDDIDALMAQLSEESTVKDVSFTSKEQAWSDYQASMGEESSQKAMDALDGTNPLPASIVIKMNEASDVSDMADKLADDELYQKVADNGTTDGNISYGKQEVDQLLSFTNTMRLVIGVFVLILIGIAYVLISNTVRNSIATRKDEIGIMRLVGASNQFIRRPFVIEGIIQALIGSLLAILLLTVVQATVLPSISSAISFLHVNIAVWQLALIYLAVTVSGIAIGVFGSKMSMKKYLTV